MKMKNSVTVYFLILLVAPPPELEMKILIFFLPCIYFIPAKLRITKEFYLPSKMKKSTKIQRLPKNSIYRAENLDGYKNTQYTNMYKNYQKNSIGRAGNLGHG